MYEYIHIIHKCGEIENMKKPRMEGGYYIALARETT